MKMNRDFALRLTGASCLLLMLLYFGNQIINTKVGLDIDSLDTNAELYKFKTDLIKKRLDAKSEALEKKIVQLTQRINGNPEYDGESKSLETEYHTLIANLNHLNVTRQNLDTFIMPPFEIKLPKEFNNPYINTNHEIDNGNNETFVQDAHVEHEPKERNIFYNADRLLLYGAMANIKFNSPKKLNLDETAKIQLLLNLNKELDELKIEPTVESEIVTARIKVQDRMEVLLSSNDFEISSPSPMEQPLDSNENVEWIWDVKPKRTGLLKLYLSVNAVIKIDGDTTRRSVKTFSSTIYVSVSTSKNITNFFTNNWQWLWAAIVLPIAGFTYRSWKSRKSKYEI